MSRNYEFTNFIDYGFNRDCEKDHYGTKDIDDIAALFDDPKFRDETCHTFDYILTHDYNIDAVRAPSFFKNILLYHMEKDGIVNELCKCSKKIQDKSKCSKRELENVLEILVDYILMVNRNPPSVWHFPFKPSEKEKIFQIFCELVEHYQHHLHHGDEPKDWRGKDPYSQMFPGFMFKKRGKKGVKETKK